MGIILNLSNNKNKSLIKAEIIINVDFPEEIINKYNIYNNAIVVNILNEIKIKAKRFNGINVNYYKAYIPKKCKMEGFPKNIIYESMIYNYNYEEARKNIINNKIRISRLIGINGEISENEFCKNLKYNTWQKQNCRVV